MDMRISSIVERDDGKYSCELKVKDSKRNTKICLILDEEDLKQLHVAIQNFININKAIQEQVDIIESSPEGLNDIGGG